MLNHDFHHERRRRFRRWAAWFCLVCSLFLVMGALVYSFQAGLLPGFAGKHAQLPALTGAASRHSSASCPVVHNPGNSTISITSDGIKRSFVVHVPTAYGQQPLPLVLNYHGYDKTAAFFARYTDMGAEADKENFLLVFPQGALDNASPPQTSWNAGIGSFGPTGTTDDVQFTRDILSYMQKNYCVDAQRVYVTGYSIGASMAYRVACSLSDQITALATVEGAFYHIPPNGCQATRPIPVLEIHGLADQLAPYNGDPPKLSVQTFLNLWFAIDQCKTSVSKVIFQKADVTGTQWPECAHGTMVEHYTISDGGHVWPGSAMPMPSLGYTTHTIDANVVIWNFFSGFQR